MTDKPNIIDRVAKYVSPAWARSRMQNREIMSILGGYQAGSKTDAIFQEFRTGTTDADSSVSWDRKTIIERNRDNIRNVPIASAISNRIVDHAIGDRGLALHPQIDRESLGFSEDEANSWQEQTEIEWRNFSESYEIDFTREQNFAEITNLTLRSELEGGDCFTLLVNKKRKGSPYDLKLQSLEGEYCSNPNNRPDTSEIVQGIEKDSDGVPTHYWFSRWHPGNKINYGLNKWQQRKIFGTSGRRFILHHQNKIRFGQTRGIPVLGPVTGKLLQIGRLSRAELLAAVINSYYTIVVSGKPSDTLPTKKSPQETTTLTADDNLTMGSGSFIRAKDNVELKSFDPARPSHRFEPFFQAMVAEIGAAVGVPKSLILMTFDKSYSASRGEVLLAWVYFLAKRTHVATSLCQPVYESFLTEAVAKGRIRAPGFFSDYNIRKAYMGSPYNQWTGPTRPAIDELKEARALAVFNNMGTQSLKEITAKTTGRDWFKVNEQIKREHELRKAAGLETDVDIAGLPEA